MLNELIMTPQEILKKLPFSDPYLFVDSLHYVNEKGASGSFRFKEDLDFYKGHFNDFPVTPGAILIEVMAQIGGASLGIYLNSLESPEHDEGKASLATTYQVEFFKPVFPNQKVTVTSEKIYFRFGKLKYKVVMINEQEEKICQGIFSGMFKALKK